jgi:glycine/D-amino acid oxidase-like deaminating enzyme
MTSGGFVKTSAYFGLFSLTHNVVIVGAGVSGLSVALALLQRGDRVTVMERGQTGSETSWAGGGILSPLLPWGLSARGVCA